MIERLRETLVFENPFIRLFNDEVRFPSGRLGTHLRILPPPGSEAGTVVLPLALGTVGLVETYRYPLAATQWGLPRGSGDAGDQGPLETAARELAEEVGAAGADLELLGRLTPDSGVSGNRVAVVVARLGAQVSAPGDPDEVKAVRWVTPEELWAEVRSGAIEDGFTLAALSMAVVHGHLAGPARPDPA